MNYLFCQYLPIKMEHTYALKTFLKKEILNEEAKATQEDENNEDRFDITLSSGDSLLIDLVRSYPHLYDKSLSDFKDSIMKENSWNEIGKIMKCSPIDCQNRWIRLREKFSKERREIEAESKSGSGISHRKGFALYENMKFLNDHVKRRRTGITNIPKNKENVLSTSTSTSTSPGNFERFSEDLSQFPLHFENPTSSNILQKERCYTPQKNYTFQKQYRSKLNDKQRSFLSSSNTMATENFDKDVLSNRNSPQSPILQNFENPTSSNILQKERCYTPQKNYTFQKQYRSELNDKQRSFLSSSIATENFDEDVLSNSNSPQSSILQNFENPTSSNILQKESSAKRCYTPQKNYTSKKRYRSESNDIEKSFLSLSNTIADKIQNLDKDVLSNVKKDEKDPEDKFLELIGIEIKKLPEDDRKKKKKEIINILWN